MPCNDPEVYIDRTVNKLRGRGYRDSKTEEEMKINNEIYCLFEPNISTGKKLKVTTWLLCLVLKNLSKKEIKKLPATVQAWWEAHQLEDENEKV